MARHLVGEQSPAEPPLHRLGQIPTAACALLDEPQKRVGKVRGCNTGAERTLAELKPELKEIGY